MTTAEPGRPEDDEPTPATGSGAEDVADELAGIEIPDDLSSLFDQPSTAGAHDTSTSTERDHGGDGHAAPDAASATDATDDDPLGEGFTVPDDLVVPDDLGALAAEEPPSVALVVTQVAVPGPLAAVCALAKVDVDAVGSPIGAIAVLRDPADAQTATRAVSRQLRNLPVVLLERRAEQVTATQWSNGEVVEELPSGLVLSDAPQVLEDLLLHGTPVGSLDGVVTSVGLSRWKAMRLLTTPPKKPKG